MRTLLAVPLCLALAGCSLNFTRPIDVEHREVVLDSGLRYTVVLTGLGEPAETGDTLEVHYEAWLEDGRRVDSSVERGMPIEFVLGEAPIAGWNEALPGMRAEGRRRMTVPPALAYGEEGVPGLVPPDATLVFEVELLSIELAASPTEGADERDVERLEDAPAGPAPSEPPE